LRAEGGLTRRTFRLAAGNDSTSCEIATGRGNDGVLPLALPVVAVQHDPITGLLKSMRARRVEEQGRVMTGAASRMESARYPIEQD
jgi:hypothetical protein